MAKDDLTRQHQNGPADHGEAGPKSDAAGAPGFGELIRIRMSRRTAVAGIAATMGMGVLGGAWALPAARAKNTASTLTFPEVRHGHGPSQVVPPGYRADVLVRWGDPITADAPEFNPADQSAASQLKQFGYNNDFISYLPLAAGRDGAARGLLCVNHESTVTELMFPGIAGDNRLKALTRRQAATEMAAHGHTVVEIRQRDGRWRTAPSSSYNRRLSTLATPMRLAGPAAGQRRLATRADPTGTRVIGTLANCAGGETPWGTVLIAEENFHYYFAGDPGASSERRNHDRYGVGGTPRHAWSRYDKRFDVGVEPNEANRFGWVVEIDPFDPSSTPVKRTALGRFKHEGATTVVNGDGRVVVYSADDQQFEYIYRFVSDGRLNRGNRAANARLLDEGTLFVARFAADGMLEWLPMVFGTGGLTPDNGFASQADVLIEARRAADVLGATPMDRPEDVEASPVTGAVYVMLTGNKNRRGNRTDAANPRGANRHGHILELIPPGGRGREADHAAPRFRWEIPILCGDPGRPGDRARYHPATSVDGWFTRPDNGAFDSRGRLWITSDGAAKAGFADGLWAMDVEGDGRALTRHFMRGPIGSELTGPCFTPDDRTLFIAVQHPGSGKGSSYAHPATRWPEFRADRPPRPAVLAVTRDDGGPIGG